MRLALPGYETRPERSLNCSCRVSPIPEADSFLDCAHAKAERHAQHAQQQQQREHPSEVQGEVGLKYEISDAGACAYKLRHDGGDDRKHNGRI
jgi:hypothetical protein